MLRPAPPRTLRLTNKWIWLGVAALLTPFVIVAAVTAVALGMSSSVTAQVQQSLQPGTVPSAYVGLIEQAATTCSTLSAPLLAAQFYQESGFNPKAVSSTGAMGIAQFEPGTWSTWASPNDGDVDRSVACARALAGNASATRATSATRLIGAASRPAATGARTPARRRGRRRASPRGRRTTARTRSGGRPTGA